MIVADGGDVGGETPGLLLGRHIDSVTEVMGAATTPAGCGVLGASVCLCNPSIFPSKPYIMCYTPAHVSPTSPGTQETKDGLSSAWLAMKEKQTEMLCGPAARLARFVGRICCSASVPSVTPHANLPPALVVPLRASPTAASHFNPAVELSSTRGPLRMGMNVCDPDLHTWHALYYRGFVFVRSSLIPLLCMGRRESIKKATGSALPWGGKDGRRWI